MIENQNNNNNSYFIYHQTKTTDKTSNRLISGSRRAVSEHFWSFHTHSAKLALIDLVSQKYPEAQFKALISAIRWTQFDNFLIISFRRKSIQFTKENFWPSTQPLNIFKGSWKALFTTYSDHKTLSFALAQRSDKYSPRQSRCLDFIAQFDTSMLYKPDEENVVGDALSRVESISIPVVLNSTLRSYQR